MRILFISFGVIVGAGIAFVLDRLFTNKLEDKNQRIGLNAAAYIVCIVLAVGFFSIFSLRAALDNFISGKINDLENKLTEIFPNTEIMEKSIDTNEFVSIINQLNQSTSDINTKGNSFFEKMIYDAFSSKLNGYVTTVQSGINTVTKGSEDGLITLKSTLNNLKHLSLDTAEPYFKFIQIAIIVLFVIFLGIYIGVVLFLKKGGGKYNKSMVFGDNVE